MPFSANRTILKRYFHGLLLVEVFHNYNLNTHTTKNKWNLIKLRTALSSNYEITIREITNTERLASKFSRLGKIGFIKII